MKLQKISFLLAALLLFSSCRKDLTEINTNPNAPINASPDLLLRQVIYDMGENNSYEGFVAGNPLGQYFTMVDFNLWDRHDLSSPQYGGKPWTYLYSNLRDNETILTKSREAAVNKVYEGPALIMKAYIAGMLTDLYGDVPYFTALQGKTGVTTPAYDRQESIYNAPGGILDNLQKGVAALKAYAGPQPLKGDVLFGGNLANWQKFGNSLRIKYLMRSSGKMAVGPQLQALFTEGNYIRSAGENAIFRFTDGPPNSFRFATIRIGDFNLFILSETAEGILKDFADPRMNIFFRPTDADATMFKGLLNGQDASKTSITVANYSRSGTIFREQTSRLKANFMTDWETSFLLAEAAERGLVSAGAQGLYESGVQAAFTYWGATLPANYLTTGAAAYGQGGADKTEQIITEKWIASIANQYEGWTEWRRTGFPKLKTLSASLNGGKIPVRLPYPADEAALNAGSYGSAAAATMGNSVNAKVWWDAR